MEKNQIRICCDSYNKHIQYYWLEENGKWKEPTEKSQFKSNKFTEASLSNIADDILKVIKDNYLRKVGVKIIFEGTEDDFSYLNAVRENFYGEYDIELVKGPRMMRPAKEVMPDIERVFSGVEGYFKAYPDKRTEAVIAKYRETVRTEISVCVMGLYSSGKSAFINSLIGKELLASDSDPETAKIYRIEENEKSIVRFQYDKKECQIEYSENKWNISNSMDNPIMESIKSKLNEIECKNEEQSIYWTLYVLTEFAKEEGEKQREALLKYASKNITSGEIKEEDEYIKKLLEKYRITDLVLKAMS
jgi:hypothetical protein